MEQRNAIATRAKRQSQRRTAWSPSTTLTFTASVTDGLNPESNDQPAARRARIQRWWITQAILFPAAQHAVTPASFAALMGC
jgi:hypothetical protein